VRTVSLVGDPRAVLDIDCSTVARAHRWPYEPWLSAVAAHCAVCARCRSDHEPYYRAIDDMVGRSESSIDAALLRFGQVVVGPAAGASTQGPVAVFVLQAVRQVLGDYRHYVQRRPEDNLDAVVWLQKAFVVSRFFEAQGLLDTPSGQSHVGSMKTPAGTKFENVTSLRALIGKDAFEFNFALHDRVAEMIRSGDHYQAMRLLCDSPKHGVLSSVLNCIATMRAKELYAIGLGGLAQAICAVADSIHGARATP